MRFYLMVQLEFLLMTSHDCLSDISRARTKSEVAFFAICAIGSFKITGAFQKKTLHNDNCVSGCMKLSRWNCAAVESLCC